MALLSKAVDTRANVSRRTVDARQPREPDLGTDATKAMSTGIERRTDKRTNIVRGRQWTYGVSMVFF